MPDLGALTLETFSQRLGEPFRLHASDELSIELTLAEASALSEHALDSGRIPFSIVFRGPADLIVPQNTYRLENDVFGSAELFIVPLAPDAAGARYEAVFA